MKEFRKKQKKLKKMMNTMCIITAVYLFAYIGLEPSLAESFGTTITIAISSICDVLIVASLIFLFLYFNRYGKSDKFLSSVEDELEDNGYYITSRDEKSVEDYYNTVVEDLRRNGFIVDEKVLVDDFEFNARAIKGKQRFYIVCGDSIDKNDVIAYQQSAIYDVTAVGLKRKGNVVVFFLADTIENDAIELSKMITPLGKKEQLKFANAMVDLSNRRCYFLGNKPTMNQKLIANYVMNCEVPLKDKYICKDKLPFQHKLEKHMEDFNINDFKNGEFYAH